MEVSRIVPNNVRTELTSDFRGPKKRLTVHNNCPIAHIVHREMNKWLSRLSILALVGCGIHPANMLAQKNVAEYHSMLDDMYKKTVPLAKPADIELSDYLILDTRAVDEYAVSHLPGAQFCEYSTFRIQNFEELPRDTPILVYCSVGYRSERIGEKLQRAGFANVHNLYGGIFNWFYEGREIVDSDGNSTDLIHTYNAKWGQWCLKGEKVH